MPNPVVKADVAKWRSFFPALQQKVHGRPLTYFDNAATTLKPRPVIDAISRYYSTINANVHRANHALGHASTEIYERARTRVAQFVGAADASTIVFTKGTTEGLNFLAHALGEHFLQSGDAVLLTESEHHSNMVPWLQLKVTKGIEVVYIPVLSDGQLDMDAFHRIIAEDRRIRLISMAHSSNLTGVMHPIEEMVKAAKDRGLVVLIDGAQGAVHQPVDVADLGCDFYVFSGHKLYGPMGIGALYISPEWREVLPPYQYGGGMIAEVYFDRFGYAEVPYRYEAGTPNVAGAAGLMAAINFLEEEIGLSAAWEYERHLFRQLYAGMATIPGVRILGPVSGEQDPILSFSVEGAHHYDVATMLDGFGVAVRAGHHCVQPLLRKWGLEGTVRASLALYNTEEEVDVFLDALPRVLAILQ